MKSKYQKFLYSCYYPVVHCLMGAVAYVTHLPLLALIPFIILFCIMMIYQKDCTPVIPQVLIVLSIFRQLNLFSYLYFYAVFIPPFICIIIHYIKFHQKFILGELFFPLLLTFLINILGGVLNGNSDSYSGGVVVIFGLCIGNFIIYYFFNIGISTPKDFDIKNYVCFSVICLTLFTIFELLFVNYGIEQHFYPKFRAYEDFPPDATLGWANANYVGYLSLIAIPCVLYLLVKSKAVIPSLVLIAIFLLGIILCGSDGSLGILIAMSPILAYFTLKHLYGKERQLLISALFVIVILVLLGGIIFVLIKGFDSLYNKFVNSFLNDTGRTQLIYYAWNLFIQKPIFGWGAFYPFKHRLYAKAGDLVYTETTEVMIGALTNYHSLIFHVLATLGVVGLLIYGYTIFKRVKLIGKRNSTFNQFMMLSFIMFELYAFIDCGEFTVILLFLAPLFATIENENKKEQPLPLNEIKFTSKSDFTAVFNH